MYTYLLQCAKSRTMWLGTGVVLLGAADAYFEVVLPPEWRAAQLVVIGALINWLRAITDKPVKNL